LCEIRKGCDTCTVLSEAYEGEAVKRASVFEWPEWSKGSLENAEDDKRSGRPGSHRTYGNVEKVRNMVHSDRHFKYQPSLLCGNIETVT